MAKPSIFFYSKSGLSRITILVLVVTMLILSSYTVYSVYLRVYAQPIFQSPPAHYNHINYLPRLGYIVGSSIKLSGDNVVGAEVKVVINRLGTYYIGVTFDNGERTSSSSTTTILSVGTHTIALSLNPISYYPKPSLISELSQVVGPWPPEPLDNDTLNGLGELA